MSLSAEELLAFVQRLGADTERWRRHVEHRADQRTYALIWDSEDVNAWVLCWGKSHDTGFHDHDQSIAGIIALEGQVREDRLHLTGPDTEHVYAAGQSFIVPRYAIHRVLHHGETPAVTIHAYSPPLTRMGSYSENDNGELVREAWDGESAIEKSLT